MDGHNMKVGIMQPYFLPYIGYWQLLSAVDKYVIYDDVNFIKGGWINRNRILLGSDVKYFNVPMIGASSFKQINQVLVNTDAHLVDKNLRILEAAYKRAPLFETVYPLMKTILGYEGDNLAEYLTHSIKMICNYLKIDTELIISSEMEKDCSLKGQDKVMEICKKLGATEYYNAVGGQELYSFEAFAKQGIQLKFLKTDRVEYLQFGEDFQANLSILDVMMFNSAEQISEFLKCYDIIDK